MSDEVDIYNDPKARARVLELIRLPKWKLCALWRKTHPHSWTAHRPETWDKQEIAWDIVRTENRAS